MASFPVSGKPVSRVDVYHVTVPVAATPQPVRLDFPSFSNRVFPGVEPIPSRP